MTPDPARLVQLLTDAGLTREPSPGEWACFTFGPAVLYVPLDLAAPEADRMMGVTLRKLQAAADVGRRAQQVLDGLKAEAAT